MDSIFKKANHLPGSLSIWLPYFLTSTCFFPERYGQNPCRYQGTAWRYDTIEWPQGLREGSHLGQDEPMKSLRDSCNTTKILAFVTGSPGIKVTFHNLNHCVLFLSPSDQWWKLVYELVGTEVHKYNQAQVSMY